MADGARLQRIEGRAEGGLGVIKIRLLGGSRVPGLHRPDGDAALILAESKWSDQGRCAPCAERRRLSRKPAQEVPLRWRSCSRYEARPNAEAALAAAAKVDERIVEKREKVRQYEAVIRRLHEELRELALLREDDGEDVDWRNFEPTEPSGRKATPASDGGGERRGLGHNCRLRRPQHVWR
jgi:hypothetical protein